MSRKSNQYTPDVTPEAFVDEFMANRVYSIGGVKNIYKCKMPMGIGVDQAANGYFRTNYKGRKVTLHKFIHETLVTKECDADDTSHLCGNAWCCNPDHLCFESRDKNISRRGCAGTVFIEEQQQWVRVCQHTPHCKIVSLGVKCDAPVESYICSLPRGY